jgi:signal transduction histidine kinase
MPAPPKAPAAEDQGADTAPTPSQERAIIAAIDGEQQLLAQALHDTVCQSLSGMNILATIIARKLQATTPELASEVAQLSQLILEAGEQVQGFVRWLRPPEIGSTGLIFALQELARETSKRVPCEVKSPARAATLAPHTAAHLYNIAQGAVSHAVERPGVTRIVITLRAGNAAYTLTMQHNGHAADGAISPSSERRFGWEVLQRRARRHRRDADLRGARPARSASGLHSSRVSAAPRRPPITVILVSLNCPVA